MELDIFSPQALVATVQRQGLGVVTFTLEQDAD